MPTNTQPTTPTTGRRQPATRLALAAIALAVIVITVAAAALIVSDDRAAFEVAPAATLATETRTAT